MNTAMDQRELDMMDIANTMQTMVWKYGRRKDVVITYEKLTAEALKSFTEWQRGKFVLHTGDERFFITCDGEPLYSVIVNADSLLTAAHELLDLIARKF